MKKSELRQIIKEELLNEWSPDDAGIDDQLESVINLLDEVSGELSDLFLKIPNGTPGKMDVHKLVKSLNSVVKLANKTYDKIG